MLACAAPIHAAPRRVFIMAGQSNKSFAKTTAGSKQSAASVAQTWLGQQERGDTSIDLGSLQSSAEAARADAEADAVARGATEDVTRTISWRYARADAAAARLASGQAEAVCAARSEGGLGVEQGVRSCWI